MAALRSAATRLALLLLLLTLLPPHPLPRCANPHPCLPVLLPLHFARNTPHPAFMMHPIGRLGTY